MGVTKQERAIREAVDKLAAGLLRRLKPLIALYGDDVSTFEEKCRNELSSYVDDSLHAMLDEVDAHLPITEGTIRSP